MTRQTREQFERKAQEQRELMLKMQREGDIAGMAVIVAGRIGEELKERPTTFVGLSSFLIATAASIANPALAPLAFTVAASLTAGTKIVDSCIKGSKEHEGLDDVARDGAAEGRHRAADNARQVARERGRGIRPTGAAQLESGARRRVGR